MTGGNGTPHTGGAAQAATLHTATPTTPTTRTAVRATVITMGLHAFCTVAMVVPGLLAPVAAADLGADASRVGVMVALIYLGSIPASLACGSVLARFGDMRAAQLSGWLCALSMVLAALAGWIGAWATAPASAHASAQATILPALMAAFLGCLLVAASLALGLGYGMLNPVGSQILFRATPPEIRSFIFSLKQSAVPIGQMLAGLIIPTLLLFVGWQAVVLAVSVMIGAYSVAMFWMRLDTSAPAPASAPRSAIATVAPTAAAPLTWRGALARFIAPARIVWMTPSLRELALIGMLYSANQLCFMSFLVSFLNLEIGVSLVLAGSLFAIAQVGGMIGRLSWGLVADRWVTPRTQVGVLGIVGGVCGVITGAFSAAWPMAVIAIVTVIYGATAAAWNGVYFAEVARLSQRDGARDEVGRMTGGLQFYMSIGAGLGPLLFSLLVGVIGTYSVGFAVFALPALLMGVRLVLRRDGGVL